MKIVVVADANLVPHRERFEAALPRRPSVLAGAAACRPTNCGTPTCTSEAASPRRWPMPRRSCELIHIAGAGTDKVEFDALPPDMLVANTFHHEQSIAEYVVAAAVMLRRGFLTQDRELRRDIWATSVYDPAIPQPSTLGDAHIGFVGFGHIGRGRGICSAPSAARALR